jgi:acyl carrier protein
MDTTLQRLSHLLERDHHLSPDQLTPETLLQDLGIDSLGTVELLWSVEDLFAIQLPHDPPTLTTLGEVARYVESLLAQQQGTVGTAPSPRP